MNIQRNNEDGLYHWFVTQAQVDSIVDLNKRSTSSPKYALSDRLCEVVDIVDNDDPRADMITGIWFTMTIGILPDGSCHS